MAEKSLVARGIAVAGPSGPLLDDVSVEAHPGRLLAVTGSSGSGKTTLLSVLGGLIRPSQGEDDLGGEAVGTRGGEPRAGTAFVLQTYGLVPSLTADEASGVSSTVATTSLVACPVPSRFKMPEAFR
jgi:putative ABC transport system ATP-binding protein